MDINSLITHSPVRWTQFFSPFHTRVMRFYAPSYETLGSQLIIGGNRIGLEGLYSSPRHGADPGIQSIHQTREEENSTKKAVARATFTY